MASGERVSFLGLGIMGEPMAANLARAGVELTVWNRTGARAERFAADHATRAAATAEDAASGADTVVTMVVDAPEVEAVLFGEHGAAAGLGRGSLVVDMSTIAPTASRRIGARLAEAGIGFLDAPVTGSRPRAEDGTLTIMVGGDAQDLERARPVLERMGRLIVHAGPQGHGSMVKLLNNTVAAANALALADALAVARAAGVDAAALLRVMAAGSGASAMLDLKAEPMLRGDFDPLFKLEHMLKDVRHCLEEARALGVDPALTETLERTYARAADAGLGERDFAAVAAAVDPSFADRARKMT